MEHPLTRQLGGPRACHGVDHLMTMALRGRLFGNDDAMWEIVEIYRESMRRRIAAVKLPRKEDWADSEVCFFLPEEALSGMVTS